MAKSATFKTYLWIDDTEIGEEQPTVFELRQMSNKQFKQYEDRQQQLTSLNMLGNYSMEDELNEFAKKALANAVAKSGFDSTIYEECVTKVYNAWIDDEFFEVLTDKEQIVNFIAGLEDQDLGSRLDDVLFRRSTLEPHEEANFTHSSGSVALVRTKVSE
jgi:hypothetical protein